MPTPLRCRSGWVLTPLRCRSSSVAAPLPDTPRHARPACSRAPFEYFHVRPPTNQRAAPFEPANHGPPRMQLPR